MQNYLKKSSSLALGLLLFGSASATAQSSSREMDALIDVLVEEGLVPANRADRVRERVAERTREAAEEAATDRHAGLNYEPTLPVIDTGTRIQTRPFRVESADGKDRFGIRGRLMIDAAFADWDDNINDASSHDNLARRGTTIRRARLGALGVYDGKWEWQMEIDFRDNEVRFANAYIAYLSDYGRFAIGNFKEPFSLESSTSSRRLTFLERATPVDAYRPDREIGLMYETLLENKYFALGVFGGDGVARDREAEEGYSLATRASFQPYSSDKVFSHLGISANYRKNSRDDDRNAADVRLRSREGSRAIDARLIGRNDIEGVDSFYRVAVEGAWGYGPFSLQGEYLYVNLDLDENLGDVRTDDSRISLDGYYLQASYFLTGEQRNYRAFSGDFGQQEVFNPLGRGGRGAWEIDARFAHADSIEHSRPGRGNKMDHYTLGLNWYPNSHTVFKINYMYFDYEGRGGTSNGNQVLGLRAQYEF